MNNCQSCGTPLDKKNTSKYNKLYCIHCQDQKTGKLKSYKEVTQASIASIMEYLNKSKEEATKIVEDTLPKLRRWKKDKK